MRGFVLQDWVTIRGATTVTSVVQNEAGWLSLEMYQDAIFWIQVSEVTLSSGSLTLNLETSPIKDETLFTPVGVSSAGYSITAAVMTPPKQWQAILSTIGSTGTPISRWVRWHLVQASATAAWDTTFRVLMSCNQLFSPAMGGGYGGYGGGGWGQQMR